MKPRFSPSSVALRENGKVADIHFKNKQTNSASELNSVFAKYRDLLVTGRSRYFARPRAIIVNHASNHI